MRIATEKHTILGRNSILEFGKYKGQRIKDIAEKDPQYIIWMDEHITTISIDQRIVEICEEDIEADTFDYGDDPRWGND